jgi:hypothetical protein
MSFDDGYGMEDVVSSILEGLRRYESGSGLTESEVKSATNELILEDDRSSDTDSQCSDSFSEPTKSGCKARTHSQAQAHGIDPVHTSLYRERLTASYRLSTTSYYFSLQKRNRESCDFVLKEQMFLKDAFNASSPSAPRVEFEVDNDADWTAPDSNSHQVLCALSSSTAGATKSMDDASSSTALTSVDEGRVGWLGYNSCSSSITFSGSSSCSSLKSCESRDDSSVSFHSFMHDGTGIDSNAVRVSPRCPPSLHGLLIGWLDGDCSPYVYKQSDSLDETAGTYSSGTTLSTRVG